MRRARNVIDVALSRAQRADVTLFHEFVPAPYGGGNQFLRALRGAFERRGLVVANNAIPPATRGCLYNSFNFDFDRLRRFVRPGCRMVHRVDGPIAVYRGRDDGSDRRIWEMNQEFAHATVFQSRYSRDRYAALGLAFKEPRVIHNAADPAIFHPGPHEPLGRGRKVRLIATSWSDNANKGGPVYRWLEEHLDWDRFEFTFVGRSPVPFNRIRVIEPQPSAEVAALLRAHDVFVTASLHESCSNALIEALSCGLPALYADSGGNAELVGDGGIGFAAREEIPSQLEALVADCDRYRAGIAAPRLDDVADRYLAALGIEV